MYIIALIVHARSLASAGRFIIRAVTKALMGGGGGAYSYICVLPDEFLLKSTVMTTDFKRNSSGRTQIYEYTPPPPNQRFSYGPVINMYKVQGEKTNHLIYP